MYFMLQEHASAYIILHLWIHALTVLLKIATHLRCGHLQYTKTTNIKGDCDKALKESVLCTMSVFQQLWLRGSKHIY